MTDVTLSAATRVALLNLQRTTGLSAITSERLATGRRVNRAVDAPAAFFQARSLTDRAGDLLAVKDSIGQSAATIGAALSGLDAITASVDQLKAIAADARGGTAAARASAAQQFDHVLGQIDALARDSGYGGVNLLASPAQSLTVDFNQAGSSALVIQGQPSDSQSLAIGTAAVAHNGFATDADIDAALSQLSDALGQLRTSASTLGSNASVLTVRQDFTDELSNALVAGAGKLTDADLSEEAAKLVSLRVANQLGAVGLTLATQSQRAIVDLVRA